MKLVDSDKVLFIDNSSWNIINFRLHFIKFLVKKGYKIYVATPRDEYSELILNNKKINFIELRYLKIKESNIYNDIKCILSIRRLYKKIKPDIVIQYTVKPNIFGNIAGLFLNTKIYSTVTGLGYPFLNKSLYGIIVPILYKVAFLNAHKVVFYNKDDKNLFVKRGIINKVKGQIIPGSGIDTSYFKSSNRKKHKKLIFLFVGRLIYDKGILEYVEASKILQKKQKHFESWIAGPFFFDNPSSIPMEAIQKWSSEKSIKYLGEVKDIKNLLEKIDVLVLPSYREGIPKSILEAMSMSKPIITTNTAGTKETVIHGLNGFLVPTKSSRKLADQMEKIFNLSDHEIRKMGDHSREIAKTKFENKIIAQKYYDLITS